MRACLTYVAMALHGYTNAKSGAAQIDLNAAKIVLNWLLSRLFNPRSLFLTVWALHTVQQPHIKVSF